MDDEDDIDDTKEWRDEQNKRKGNTHDRQIVKNRFIQETRIWKRAQEPELENKMAKTMYSSHTDGAGNTTPIPMLKDGHLENIIRQKTDRFIFARTKYSEAPTISDPMMGAMARSIVWTAEDLQKQTQNVPEDLQGYICEAVMRGGGPLNQACDSLRKITKREAMIPTPVEPERLSLEFEEDEF